ncbi:phage tail tape measure C-terminal domain-containing protein [Geothrix fuzhouensis]|uniref:phage tail tape measure C-terminal domain-containing protein n=1 Tax=Geothrix fuzhouensis TaxID=2966451 RepID=UPI0021486CDE|nr:phage tail tape measure C-terminal domain-containing protein [Geothrix fuzhouensis]
MNTYKVEVEFVAQVEQLKSQLNQAMASIKGTDASATAAGSALDRMGGAGAAAGQKVKKGAAEAGESMKDLSGNTTTASADISKALTGMVGKLATVAMAWKALKAVFGFGEMGIEYNSIMETAQLGIGSLIAAQAKLVDGAGQELKGREALNAALVLSADQMQKLKIAGLETVATTQQLVVAYQQAVGVGLSVGMNLDEIREITIKITQAAAALGLPMNQLAEEVRDLLQGNINPRNTRIATALNITNEEVRKWQAAGGHTLADELNKRMEAFGIAGEKAALTWSGVTSNVVEATQTMAGAMTQPLFDKIKDNLQNALKDAFDLKNARISDAFSGLVEAGQEVSSALGDLFQEALGWAVQSAKDLSAWFKENRKDVIEMVGTAKALAEQLGGVLKDVISIVGAANQAQGQFSILKTLIEGIGLTIAVVRDVVSIVAFALQTVGVFLLQGVLGPIQLVLIGIGEAMNYVKKGSGDLVVKVAEDMQKFLDQGHAGADAFLKPILDGKGAVAQFGDALLEAKVKAMALGDATKKAAAETANVLPKPKPPEAADRSGIISAAEIEARLAALRADAEEKVTLEQQKQHALSEVNKQYLIERARLLKEASEGKFDGNQAGVDQLWAANIERRKSREAAINKDFADKRIQMEGDLQSRLTAGEEGGLQQRYEAVRKAFDKIRAEAAKLRTAQTTDAQKAAQDEEIREAERAAKARARMEQVKADLAKLKQELAELAQIRGHALAFDEQEEVMTRFAARSREAAEAVAKLREELHLNGTATQGWLAGIRDWLGQASNAFTTFKNMATQVINGVEQSFTRGIAGIISGQMTLSQGFKAIWQGIVQTLAQAVAQMIARWLIMKIVGGAMTKDQVAQSDERTAHSLTAGAAAAWEAYGSIPYVGWALALAQIAMMVTSVAGVGIAGAAAGAASGAGSTGAGVGAMSSGAGAVATVRDVGGLVTEPEFTWLAKNGIPEVVAPESDFKDWARSMVGMGANLQANVNRNNRIEMGYALQGAGYAASAVSTSRDAAEQGEDPRVLHLSFPNAQIYDTSDRGRENLGNYVMEAVQVAARRRGQVIEPGQVFGGI